MEVLSTTIASSSVTMWRVEIKPMNLKAKLIFHRNVHYAVKIVMLGKHLQFKFDLYNIGIEQLIFLKLYQYVLLDHVSWIIIIVNQNSSLFFVDTLKAISG